MNKNDRVYREHWWQRILKTRKRYFFEYIKDHDRLSAIFFWQIINWMKDDIVYIFKWTVNILLQIRAYGYPIKKQYGLNRFKQFFRMAHLAFIIGVKPDYFRILQLYKPDSWKFVQDYAYFHTPSQREFAQILCRQEVNLFLDKYKFFQFCRSHHIHTPNVFAVYQKGDQVYPANQVNLPKEDLFIKNQCGQMGWGAKKLWYNQNLYMDKEEKKYNMDDVFKYLSEYSRTKSAAILQSIIVNHPAWQKFTPGALATCRIVTAKSHTSTLVSPLFAAFRMPLENSDTDNFSDGGVVTSIEIKSGILGKIISSRSINGSFDFSHHPQTHHKVEGKRLPFWEDLVEFTIHLHSKVKSPFVGWDVCMTEQGCCVLEGSLIWDAGSYEIVHQKPLINTTYPVLFEQWMEKSSGAYGE